MAATLIILVAFFWTFLNSTRFLGHGNQTCTQYSKCGYTYVLPWKNTTLFLLYIQKAGYHGNQLKQKLKSRAIRKVHHSCQIMTLLLCLKTGLWLQINNFICEDAVFIRSYEEEMVMSAYLGLILLEEKQNSVLVYQGINPKLPR